MNIFKDFGKRKRRKYPVKWDETGQSGRQCCFELFMKKMPLDEISKTVGIKIETVRRYHRQWKQNPYLERQYALVKCILDNKSADRDSTIELLAKMYGVEKERIEEILSQPHGLRRLLSGKLNLPAQVDAAHQCYVALVLGSLIAHHFNIKKGELEDCLYAIEDLLEEEQWHREKEEENVAFLRKVARVIMENDKQGRGTRDRLTEEERNAILGSAAKLKKRRTESEYWASLALKMINENLTPEEARGRMVQELVDKGDINGAMILRVFQDEVHPLNTDNQIPPPSPPPTPPA